ncbi:hypothetical protein ABPG74_003899, partial [Tetrahymena malaccensis]
MQIYLDHPKSKLKVSIQHKKALNSSLLAKKQSIKKTSLIKKLKKNILKESYILDKNENDFYKNQIKSDQNQTVDREEELKEEGIQQVFVPSFDTKLIQSLDPTQMLSPKNQEQQLLSISPKSQNNRFFLNVQAEQKLQVKKQSMFNQEVSLNSEQRRKQRKIKIANSQLQKQNSFSDSNQIQNTICESQEAIKEPFKGLSKYAHFKRSQSIYSEGLQNSDNIQQIDKTQKFKSTQELFRVSDYQQSLGLGTCDKRAIDDHINQSLDILQLYKDIIFFKKAISILLGKDQLAVLQLIGLSSEYFKQQPKTQNEDYIQIQNDNNLQSIFIPSFNTKSIKSADNSMNKIQNKIYGQQNKVQNQFTHQKNENESNLNQSKLLDIKQKVKQRKINTINSPIKIKSKINIDQFQNNIEVSTLKSQETSQEKLYLPQTRINSQKNAYNLNSESHQGHLKIDHSESIQKISSYYKKVFESIQNTSLMKKIKIIIYKT